ncbi:hypothetical protein QAD02_015573 [Eretmocerus hayati]|uniref:Uncharacterized protein n=1 Tax=Eretmocerus hayati TaxID=131215 RepID=A0ACC2P9W7_9HYME|nr:hypothetical protein QAD02_015573 [Eretmocerus hayati]
MMVIYGLFHSPAGKELNDGKLSNIPELGMMDSKKASLEDGNSSIKGKLSIQQILEGMTNEFNKPGTKKPTETIKRVTRTEAPVRRSEKTVVKSIDEIQKSIKVHKCVSHTGDGIKVIKENIPEKKVEKSKKTDELPANQEVTNKKDASASRIVLTFRTIDENTDHGKKTKISSCPSNLSLVPDEHGNCDKISGVSVKIESFEDANKSESSNGQTNGKLKSSKATVQENDKNVSQPHDDAVIQTLSKEKSVEIRMSPDNQKNNLSPEKSAEESESPQSNMVKSGQKRPRDSSDETGLKRSTRRMRDSSRFSVLANAMARKEQRFNLYEDSSAKKYTKPVRPKRLVINKKDNIPKLTPLDPSKFMQDKKITMPKLCPLNPPRSLIENSTDSTDDSTLEDSPKRNKYEGMPKLTPIIKTSESLLTKFSESVNNSGSQVKISLLKKPSAASGVFLKPISKPEQEKKQPPTLKDVPTTSRELIPKEKTVSPIEPQNAMNTFAEEHPVPAKKVRRSMIPSPSTAEGSASKPESTAILSRVATSKPSSKKVDLQCLCEAPSQLFVTITTAEAPLFCTALDSVDSRIVGCSNEVDHDDVAMRRPSSRIPYIILCRMHKERLIRHNCCPTCGLFCCQGKFVHCSNGHQYHRDCEIHYDEKQLCPHCYSHGRSYDVVISMSGKRKPVHLPPSMNELPKTQVLKESAARISLPGPGDNTKLTEHQTALRKTHEPLVDPNIVKIPEPATSEKPERYTISSLLAAVKSEDVQKLVNVLANGFNANHIYREQSNRTSLHIAAEKGFLAGVHVLVQAGAQLDVLDRNQKTPLMMAAVNGHSDVVRYLIRIGADVTMKGEDGMTTLHVAARAGQFATCKTILSECKTPRSLVDVVDDGGWTSLIWACEFQHVEVAKLLIENKCDPLIRDSEQNIALHWSAFSGCSEISEILIDMGSDVNAVNVHGDTPLHIAARQDRYDVAVLLLSRGARIGEVNVSGETALDCCGIGGDTYSALQLNFKVNERSEFMLDRTVKILTNDISRGKEGNPIQCVNGVDYEDKPTDFVYVTENCYTSRINVDRTITSLQSCRCEDTCSSEKCLCGNISLRCWYDEEGRLNPDFNYADPPMLFECNPACDCNRITCNNRVVQHGLTQRFQLFRTPEKGWGLKTLRPIPKGTYVCEYVGEIISDLEADLREDDSYLFDLDNRDGETYCIDARRYGNIARFINHSCSPNLLPVRVFIDHQDLRFPRIAFFANRDIDVDEELGFDYGEKFWIVKCKSFTCTCGAENCRYSDKAIQITLDNYRKRVQQEERLAVLATTAQRI